MTDLNAGELESLRQHWYRLGFEDGRKIGREEWRDGHVYHGSGTPPECQHDYRQNSGTVAGSTCRKCGRWEPPLQQGATIT